VVAGPVAPKGQGCEPFEAALPAALQGRSGQGVDWSSFPGAWLGQYVGLIRGGRRYIYGNFVPGSTRESYATLGSRDESRALTVCDGGPAFFGADYDVEARGISHLAFNGRM
jgi:hypothetical protein